MTGHLVLSTIHTIDAAAAAHRLVNMGTEQFLVATALRTVVAQRLVRRLCPHCTALDPQTPEVLKWLGLEPGTETFRGSGCDHCYHTGYRGRTAIGELLITDSTIRQLVLDHSDADQIRNHALATGMRTLLQDATLKVLARKTSVEEVIRVCGAEQPPPVLVAKAQEEGVV